MNGVLFLVASFVKYVVRYIMGLRDRKTTQNPQIELPFSLEINAPMHCVYMYSSYAHIIFISMCAIRRYIISGLETLSVA